jgi:alkylation response protein AidB-like acyl-CoA dehydrogenase
MTSAAPVAAPWELGDAELAVRDRTRALARELMPIALALRDGDPYPQAMHDRLAAEGLMGLMVPTEFGGSGAGLQATCIAIEELAKVSLTATMMVGASALAAVPIRIGGNPDHARRWLPGLAAGELRGAFALSEPTAGSDAAALRCKARRDGDEWVIDGSKRFIGNAASADVFVVFARTGGPGARGVSAFVVPGDTPGVTVMQLEPMGLPGWDLGAPRFTGVRIPADHILGEEGGGFRVAMATLERTRPTVAAQGVGLGQGAIELATEYALKRHTFGKPVFDHQAVAFRLAELEAEVTAARLLTYQAAAFAESGHPDRGRISSMSKMLAANVAMAAATEAVQVLGGNGWLRSYPAERILRDAKILQIFEGTTEVQKLIISRTMRTRAETDPMWPMIVPAEDPA